MKSSRTRHVLAASLVVGGVTLFPPASACAADNGQSSQDQTASVQSSSDLKLPPGTAAVNEPKKDNMTESLAEATAAVVKDGQFENLVDHFVDQDRNRMSNKGGDTNYDDIKQLAADLQKDFKDKYGKDFDIQDDDVKAKVFSSARAVEGEISDPVALMKTWPADPSPATAGNQAQTAGKTLRAGSEQTTDEANIEKGREVGIVRLPGSGNTPTLDVSMIDEAGGWKIDVPNNRSAEQIHQDVAAQLKQLRDQKDQWPDDATEAYKTFTSHVLMGVYGVESQQQQKG
jgi:hypothetical protein